MADEDSTADAGSSKVTGENPESTVEINIKTLDSKIYTFRVDKDMPVPVLKEKLVDVTGIPVQRQRLIYRGKVLKDDHLLSEYHLEDGHTLHLVARQPVEGQSSSGVGPEGAAQDNNQGGDSTPGAPRNRIGQISHSVLLGTLNVAEPGENMVADISRLVGAVLSSFGVSSGDPAGSVSGTPSVAAVSASSGAEAERNQNSSGSPVSNPMPSTSTGLNIPLPSLHQVPQFPPARFLSPHMTIPDSLSTLSEFISRMEDVLQNGVSQSSPSNTRVPSTETPSLTANGAPTPEMLRRVMEQAQELLRGNAAAALSRVATRLEREGTSTDTAVRGQIQAEALQVGAAMQHLGAMLLELGRTIMTLRMGQSPADSVVNAGPAVYISSSGPNPIMVQPFPMQTNSLFGIPPAMVNGASGDPSRHVNIHIHAGSSFIPGVSNVAARGASGEAQQANREGNGVGNSAPTPGFPPRTVVAAIPTRPPTQTSGHVVSVIYPVQVRSQLSVPFPSASAEAANPTMSSSGQRPTVVTQPSSETGTLPSLVEQISAQVVNALVGGSQRSGTAVNTGTQPPVVAPQPSSESRSLPPFIQQISAQVANALAGGAQRFGSLSQSVQTTEAQGSLTQSNMAGQMDQTPLITNNAPGHSPSLNTLSTDSSCLREGPQQASPDSTQDDVKDHTGNADSAEQESTSSKARGVSMPTDEVHELPQESSSKSNNLHSNGGSGINVNSSATISAKHTAQLGEGSDSNRVTPLGLGLGGLQPKRRGKTEKTVGNDNVKRQTPPVNQDPQSIARVQQHLQSLASQSSDGERANTNSTSSQQTSLVGQNMNSLPSQDQATNGQTQVDPADMMSLVLRTPAFGNILSGVAEQTGIGSSDDLRSMLEQCTQNPAIRDTLNNITQQVQREPESLGAIFSEIGSGQGGGLDFSRMIQHMMPAVSQALRGSAGSASARSLQSNSQPQSDNGGSGADDMRHERNSTADIRRAVESIEQHDSPRNIFSSVLESAGRLLGEQNSFGDLVNTLVNNEELADDFMRMLCRDLHRRTQADSTSEQ